LPTIEALAPADPTLAVGLTSSLTALPSRSKSCLTTEQNKYIKEHIKNMEPNMTRLFVVSLTEIVSLGTFIAMILTWAAILSAPGV
jgi:hypothetical protein